MVRWRLRHKLILIGNHGRRQAIATTEKTVTAPTNNVPTNGNKCSTVSGFRKLNTPAQITHRSGHNSITASHRNTNNVNPGKGTSPNDLDTTTNTIQALKQKIPKATVASHAKIFMSASHLTLRLRHAGPMMFDCQPRRDPGVACSRFVRRPVLYLSHTL